MQSNNANAIAASLCESSENVLKNEKLLRKDIEFFQKTVTFFTRN